jgi:hypothetical protein
MPTAKLPEDSVDYDSDGSSRMTEQSFVMTDHDAETSSLTSFHGEEINPVGGSQPDESVRSSSPAQSVYSLTTSLLESSFVNIHGRALNSHSDVYQLPADEEEIYRLGESANSVYG